MKSAFYALVKLDFHETKEFARNPKEVVALLCYTMSAFGFRSNFLSRGNPVKFREKNVPINTGALIYVEDLWVILYQWVVVERFSQKKIISRS